MWGNVEGFYQALITRLRTTAKQRWNLGASMRIRLPEGSRTRLLRYRRCGRGMKRAKKFQSRAT